jgi:hypothetical protein
VTISKGAATDRLADLRLAAVLESKPPTDQVSLAAWWFVVGSLESSVRIRRAIEGVEPLSWQSLEGIAVKARSSTRAALEELPGNVVSIDAAPVGSRPRTLLRSTVRKLALLVVTPRVTTAEQLSEALYQHLDALQSCTRLPVALR